MTIGLRKVSILYSCHNLNACGLFNSLFKDIDDYRSGVIGDKGLSADVSLQFFDRIEETLSKRQKKLCFLFKNRRWSIASIRVSFRFLGVYTIWKMFAKRRHSLTQLPSFVLICINL